MATNAPVGTTVWDVVLDTSKGSRQLNQFAAEVNRTIGNVDKNLRKISIGDNFARPLGRISASVNEFNKSLEASNARVLAFGASVGALYTVQRAMTELVKSTIEVEKSLTDINVILNTNKAGLKSFGNELFNIAKNTNQSFAEVAKAATELARQGLSAQETLKRTRDALVLVQLTGMDSASAVESITAALNSFNKQVIDSTQLVSKFAKVDAAFAVSSADLAEAIRRVGSSAQDAGVGIDELIALVTAAQQTTARGGSVIGNSLKTIFTRLQRQDTIQALEDLGVAVRDTQNNLLSAEVILKNFAKTYDTLGQAQKAQAAELVGGVFQINILKATLGDLGKQYSFYDSALRASNSATNEAILRSEELNKTLSALVNRTFVNLKQLGSDIGGSAIDKPLRTLLGGVNDLLLEPLNAPQNTQETGAKIGKGILEGIGQFLSGPGIVLAFAGLKGIAQRLGADFFQAFKTVSGITAQADLQRGIERDIVNYLAQDKALSEQILKNKISLVEVQKQYVASINQSFQAQKVGSLLAPGIAAQLGAQNISLNTATGVLQQRKTKSGGLIPALEKIGAYSGGYTPGPIATMNVSGLGNITYNKAEKVVDFGFSQPAIMPPAMSKAGASYKRSFMSVHGFNPYNYAASGLLPVGAGPRVSIKDIRGETTNPVAMAVILQKAQNDLAALRQLVRSGELTGKELVQMSEQFAKDFSLTAKAAQRIAAGLKTVSSQISSNRNLLSQSTVFQSIYSGTTRIQTPRTGLLIPEQMTGAQVYTGGGFSRARQQRIISQNAAAGNAALQSTIVGAALSGASQNISIARNAQIGNIGLSAEFQRAAQLEARLASIKAARARRIETERLITEINSGKIQKAIAGQEGLSGLFFGGSKLSQAERLAASNPLLANQLPLLQQARNQRTQRIQNAALGATFAGPIVAQTIAQFIPPENRVARAAAEGAGDLQQFTSLGAFFGKTGFGLAIGGIIGSFKVLEAASDRVPEFRKRLEEINNTTARLQESFQRFTVIQNRLSDIENGRVASTTTERDRLRFEQRSIIERAPESVRDRLLNAFQAGNETEVNRLIVETLEVKSIEQQAVAAGVGLLESRKNSISDVLSFTGERVGQNALLNRFAFPTIATPFIGNERVINFGRNFLAAQGIGSSGDVVNINGRKELRAGAAESTRAQFQALLGIRNTQGQTLGQFLGEDPKRTGQLRRILGSASSGQNVTGELEDFLMKQFGFEGNKEILQPTLLFFDKAVKTLANNISDADTQFAIFEQMRIAGEEWVDATTKAGQALKEIKPPDFTKENRLLLNKLISSGRLESDLRGISRDAALTRSAALLEKSIETASRIEEIALGGRGGNLTRQQLETEKSGIAIRGIENQGSLRNLSITNDLIRSASEARTGARGGLEQFFLAQQKTLGNRKPEEFATLTKNFLSKFESDDINTPEGVIGLITKLRDESEKVLKDGKYLEGITISQESRESLSKLLSEEANNAEKALRLFEEQKISNKELIDISKRSELQRLSETIKAQFEENRISIDSTIRLINFNSDLNNTLLKFSSTGGFSAIKELRQASGLSRKNDISKLRGEFKVSDIQGLVSQTQLFSAQRDTGLAGIGAGLAESKLAAEQAFTSGQRRIRGGLLRSATGALNTEGLPEEVRKFISGNLDTNRIQGQIQSGDFGTLTNDLGNLLNQTKGGTDQAKAFADKIKELISQIQEATQSEQELINTRNEAIEKAQQQAETERQLLEERIKLQREQSRRRLAIASSGRSGANIRSTLEAVDLEDISGGTYGLGNLGRTFTSQFVNRDEDVWRNIREGAISTAETIKSSFNDAFKSFIDGTESASDAARKFGISIFENILSQSIQIGTNSLFGGTLGRLFTGKAKGGIIKKYAVGGSVYGGSGTKDDVPALLSAGEFVVNRYAASKYRGLLENMNSQSAYSSLQNQFVYNGARPTSGSLVADSNLSALALLDENNPQNALRESRESGLYSYLREFSQYQAQRTDAMAQYRRAQRQRLTGAYMSGLMNVAGGALSGIKTGSGVRGGVGYDAGAGNALVGNLVHTGGAITKNGVYTMASGGGISQYSSDSVPAVLTAGEFVVNRNAVAYYGQDYFNRLNRMQISRGEQPAEYAVSMPSRASGSAPQQTMTAQQVIENNVSINITTNSQGQTTADVNSSSNNGGINQEQAKQVGLMVKDQVLKIITQEQRPGGKLYQANTAPRY